ncbi:MAG: S1 family peptidase [bacterium]
MKRIVLLIGCLFFALGIFAQNEKEQAKQIINAHKNAVLTVRVLVNEWFVSQGQESSKEETKYEAIGTVIDKNSTIATSASSVDPSKAFQQMFGERDYQIRSEVRGIKIILPDNKEVDGKIVLRDDKLDLVFIRPVDKSVQLEYVDLDASSEPELIDDVIGIQRLGEEQDRALFVSISKIGGIVNKPRKYYLPMNAFSPGSPVFTLDGKIVGICLALIRKMEESETPFAPGMFFSFMRGGPFNLVILPAKTVKESAAQIKE